MMISIYVVDAFTNERFSGNPAAVCLLSAPMPEEWMQKVEVNHDRVGLSGQAVTVWKGELID